MTAPFICLAVAGAAACASIADLDVQYPAEATGADDVGDAIADGPRFVRESSTTLLDAGKIVLEPGPMTPCIGEAGLDDDGGCDEKAGLGCCIKTAAADDAASSSACMQQWQAPTECPDYVFIACRRSVDDSTCCWRTNGKGRSAVYTGVCEGGLACVDDADCPSEGPLAGCHVKTCPSVAFPIGECGADPKCPEEL